MTSPTAPTHARLNFADGFERVLLLTDSIRVRHIDVNGVETWPVQTIVSGLYPPGDRQADYVHVEVTGREHRLDGVRIATGTITSAVPPLAVVEAEHAAPVPDEVEPAPPDVPLVPPQAPAPPPVEPVVAKAALAPRTKRSKKPKAT